MKIIARVLIEGNEYPRYEPHSDYAAGGTYVNIRSEVLEAIKEVGLPLAHLKSSQIISIAQFILTEELKTLPQNLEVLSFKINDAEVIYKDLRDKEWSMEAPANNLRQRISRLDTEVSKLKKEAARGGKDYERKLATRNALVPEKMREIYVIFKTKMKESK